MIPHILFACGETVTDEYLCPGCGAAIAHGVELCARCGAELDWGDEGFAYQENLVDVLRTFNVIDVALVKSVFAAESIPCIVMDEYFSMLSPMVMPARVLVHRHDQERATRVIGDLTLSFTYWSSDPVKPNGAGPETAE